MDQENKIENKKTGPKRIYDVPDCENRNYKVKNIYLTNRYKNDEEFRLYRKIINAINYQKRKEKMNNNILIT